MKFSVFIASILISFGTATKAFCQSSGNFNYNQTNFSGTAYDPEPPIALAQEPDPNVMIFEVNGLANVVADAQVAIFNITQLGPDVQQVDSLVRSRTRGFSASLQALGIPHNDVFVDMISQVPIYEYEVEKKRFSKKTFNEIPAGIEVQKNIHVRFGNGNALEGIVAAAAQNEIFDLVKVEYYVANKDSVYADLRKRSIAVLNEKIEDFTALGIHLDTVYRVIAENAAVAYPPSRYKRYEGFSSASLEAVNKRSEITNVRKPKTMYYDKVAFEGYDLVLNPVILEPVVQFSYNLKIKFLIERRPSVQLKREIMLLTPEGVLTPLKVD